jgi:hypothetical protein
MHVPIGHDLDDRPVRVHLAPGAVGLLIGDPRSGRTTLARHLARCWLADLTHTLRLDVDRPDEYADLASLAASRLVASADYPLETEPRAADLGEIGELWLHDHRYGSLDTGQSTDRAGPVLITADAALAMAVTESLGDRVTWGIAIEPLPPTRHRTLRSVDDASSPRLDLPTGASMIRVATFGVADQPPHRWHMVGTAS